MSTLTASKVNKKSKNMIDPEEKGRIINNDVNLIDKTEEIPNKKIVKVIRKKREIDPTKKLEKPIKKIEDEKNLEVVVPKTEELSEPNNNENKKTINTNQDSSFILKKNKQSGNFSILKKSLKPGIAQKVKYIAYNVLLPFGREEYNDNLILNAIISDSTNFNYNLITTLKRIVQTFEGLRDTEPGKFKYSINDKKFFSYMKELKIDEYNDDDIPEDKIINKNSVKQSKEKSPISSGIKKYQLRLYLRYGAKVTHAKHVGELSYDQLRGKKCNLDLELGSMWVSSDTMMYGINIHVTHITVLN